MKAEEPAAEETTVETAEETAAETTETETTETETTETEAAEAEEAEETTDADTSDEETAKILADAEEAGKKASKAVNVLAALIVVALVVIAFLLGGKLMNRLGDAEDTTAVDTTVDVTGATDVTDATDAADEGEIPFDGYYDSYETAYPNGFDYKNTDVSEYITLGNYKNQTVAATVTEGFTDEEFADMINYFLLQYATLGDVVTDRAAQMNDTVIIDYAGTVDGVAFDGGTASEQTATIGMGQYITGFEEGIIGMNIGETKNVYVTFPENYGVDTLNGKDAVFAITLRSITENILPEYNDEFVKNNFSIDTVEEFEAMLHEEKASDAEEEKSALILELLTETSEMKKFPDGAVDDYISQQVAYDKYYASAYGVTVSEFISGYYGITVAQYEEQLKVMAESMIKQEFALYAVAAAEGITVSDDEMSTEIQNYLDYYGYTDMETLCTEMGITEELLTNSLHFSVVYTKVMEFMMENTTFVVVE